MKQPTINEVWKSIPGYEGVYEVSNLGRVRSLDRYVRCRGNGRRLFRGRVLSGKYDRDGYHLVSLNLEGKEFTAKAHRLVLLAFVGPCPSGHVVRHLDGDPGNNSLDNLAYGTYLDNSEDQRRHGTHGNTVKTNCPKGHEYTPENTKHYMFPSGRKSRFCRTCDRERSARRSAERKASKQA